VLLLVYCILEVDGLEGSAEGGRRDVLVDFLLGGFFKVFCKEILYSSVSSSFY